MDNSFFVFTNKPDNLVIERFHICTWEFNNNTSLVEFGFEISRESFREKENLAISLFVPWLTKECRTKDLYEKLKIADNSRFIFNDSINRTDSFDGGRNKLGVVHVFNDRAPLCIQPIDIETHDKIINIKTDLKIYNNYNFRSYPNIYFRFWIQPKIPFVSMRKNGINKSTIIYDIKVNEKRNIPENQVSFFNTVNFCKINSCFSFNIIPNKYDIVFFENVTLKNVRTLEYESFNKYLGDRRVKKDELIVVFNKKQNSESFSFFSIFSNERIGTGQFALALLINIICGIILFVPSFRKSFSPELSLFQVWYKFPIEIYIAIGIIFLVIIYFLWPKLSYPFVKLINKFKQYF